MKKNILFIMLVAGSLTTLSNYGADRTFKTDREKRVERLRSECRLLERVCNSKRFQAYTKKDFLELNYLEKELEEKLAILKIDTSSRIDAISYIKSLALSLH